MFGSFLSSIAPPAPSAAPVNPQDDPNAAAVIAPVEARSRSRRLLFSALLFGLMSALLVVWFMKTKKHLAEMQDGLKKGPEEKPRGRPARPPAGTDAQMEDIADRLVSDGWKLIGRNSCGHTVVQLDIFGDKSKPARKAIDAIYTECEPGKEREQCPGIEGFPAWRNGSKVVMGSHVTLAHLEQLLSSKEEEPKGREAPTEAAPAEEPKVVEISSETPKKEAEPEVKAKEEEEQDAAADPVASPEPEPEAAAKDEALVDALLESPDPAPATEAASPPKKPVKKRASRAVAK